MTDVIIPIYNTPINELARCFNSIKEPAYKEYNDLLINDGSKKEFVSSERKVAKNGR